MTDRDRELIEEQTDPELREAMVCALTAYRRPDRLAVGDAMPDLTLSRLDATGGVRLAGLRGRPVVLFFGSYT
jgi:hypothetical protein